MADIVNRSRRELRELIDSLAAPTTTRWMTVVMALCADLARRDAEDLYAAGGSDGGDATDAVLTEAAGTCLELHTSGPAAVTEWLAARLGATGAWVALHARLAATPASPLPDRS